jgi:hypothetical protein
MALNKKVDLALFKAIKDGRLSSIDRKIIFGLVEAVIIKRYDLAMRYIMLLKRGDSDELSKALLKLHQLLRLDVDE